MKVIPAWSELLKEKKLRRKKLFAKNAVFVFLAVFIVILYTVPLIGKELQISKIKMEKKSFQTKDEITVNIGKFRSEDLNVHISKIDGISDDMQLPETEYVIEDDMLKIEPENSLSPGKYKVIIKDGSRTIFEQDYSWGVLALNTSKSVYEPNDNVHIAIGVLDKTGDMVCDAWVELEITSPSGEVVTFSTDTGTIKVNEECLSKDVTLVPDYETNFVVSEIGEYEVKLAAKFDDELNTVQDKIVVLNEVLFDVERLTSTRIYPLNQIPVTITLRAEKSFKGYVEESVPADFEIFTAQNSLSFSKVEITGDRKVLTWYLELEKDQEVQLGYYYDAPDISPYLFLIDPLKVYEEVSLVNSLNEDRTVQEQKPDLFIISSRINSLVATLISAQEKILGVKAQELQGLIDNFESSQSTASFENDDNLQNGSLPGTENSLPIDGSSTGVVANQTFLVFEEYRSWQIASDATGNLILFWDNTGSSAPIGWSCISCSSGQDFYQRFVRGAATYGTTGGSASHTPTVSSSLAATTSSAIESGGTDLPALNHTHTFTPTVGSASNLPSYRQLRIIRSDTAGEPSTLPAGVIAVFDAAVPSGWTRYSAQDSYYVYGEDTVGTAGGSNSHSHTVTGTTGAAVTNSGKVRGGGTPQTGAATSHTHSVSSNTGTLSNEPPNIAVILGKLNSDSAPVNGIIGMWTDTPATSWDIISGSGQSFEGRFIKGSASYGSTGGSTTHTHANIDITTGVPSATVTGRSGTTGSSGTHTHTISLTNFSETSHLPPYREVIFAKRNDQFTVSGTCRQNDEITNCTNSQTVRVVFNTALQTETGTTTNGSWSITIPTPPGSGDVITVYLQGVSDSNEAVAVTKYDGDGSITGVRLIENTLSLGSGDNPTLTNADLATYDNSVSANEDIFYDVDSNNDLTVNKTGQAISEKLQIEIGTSYRPDSTSSGNIDTHHLDIHGTLTLDGNTADLSGSWLNTATFNSDTSTVNFTATSGSHNVNSTGAVTHAFNNVKFGQTSGTAIWTMQSSLDANGNLDVSAGTLVMNGSNNITVGGNLTIGANGAYTKGTGTITFDGTGTHSWGDSSGNLNDFGNVAINGTNETINLSASVALTSLNVAANQTLDLGSSGNTLLIDGSGTGGSRPFIINGTFSAGSNSTVIFSGTSSTDVDAATFHNLNIQPDAAGSPTFTIGSGTLTTNNFIIGDGTNSVTVNVEISDPVVDVNGVFTVNANAIFTASSTASFSIAGSFTNDGTFNEGTGTVTLDGITSVNLDSGCSAAGSCTNGNFYNLVINKTDASSTNDNVTLTSTDLRVTNTLTITDGELIQGVQNLRAEGATAISVSSNGAWANTSTGDITLGGDVTANGSITLQGNGPTCGDADDILIRSTDNTSRNWNGTGTFFVNDVDVHRQQGSASITAYSSTSSNPMGANWTVLTSCSANNAPDSPTSLVQTKTDTTSLSTGAWTNETTVRFAASATDPDSNDQLQLCIEAQPLGTGFTNTENGCGSGVVYSGSAVTVEATLTLTDAQEYHWQARIRDSSGAYSNWVSYDTNLESERDFGIDTTAPTGGSVYDGTSTGVDSDYSSTSLSELSANWENFNSNVSGLDRYEYSIGSTQGGTDVKGWTSTGTSTSVTTNSLTLQSSKLYYFNVRAIDNAGNVQTAVSSDGQMITPSLTFSFSPTTLSFGNLNTGNNYTDTQAVTLTTSTNAYNGYIIRAYITDLLRSANSSDTIQNFDGGSYSAPGEWLSGNRGFGYTSSDTSVQGVNKFTSTPCLGGGNPPCYAPFSQTVPGDIVVDHTSNVSGTPISNEQFTVTYRVQTNAGQEASTYTTTVIYTVTAVY